jgi:hypothetical protein
MHRGGCGANFLSSRRNASSSCFFRLARMSSTAGFGQSAGLRQVQIRSSCGKSAIAHGIGQHRSRSENPSSFHLCIHTDGSGPITRPAGWRVTQAFDLSGPIRTKGAPSLRLRSGQALRALCEGWEWKCFHNGTATYSNGPTTVSFAWRHEVQFRHRVGIAAIQSAIPPFRAHLQIQE